MEVMLSISLIIWISFCLVMFFFSKTDSKNIVKFIGGFSVALIAIHANDPYVYFLSVAITGLIIANERFMSVLVALIRGKPELWKYDNFTRALENMSPAEIEHKTQQEIQEVKETIEEETKVEQKPHEKKLQDKAIKEFTKLVPEIEKKALSKYQKLNNIIIKEQVKIGRLLLDGIGVNKKGNKLYVFEVKFIPVKNKSITDGNLSEKIIYVLRRTIPNMLLSVEREMQAERNFGFENITLMIIIVIDSDRNLDTIMEKVGALKSAYNDPQNNIAVHFQFYNVNKL